MKKAPSVQPLLRHPFEFNQEFVRKLSETEGSRNVCIFLDLPTLPGRRARVKSTRFPSLLTRFGRVSLPETRCFIEGRSQPPLLRYIYIYIGLWNGGKEKGRRKRKGRYQGKRLECNSIIRTKSTEVPLYEAVIQRDLRRVPSYSMPCSEQFSM